MSSHSHPPPLPARCQGNTLGRPGKPGPRAHAVPDTKGNDSFVSFLVLFFWRVNAFFCWSTLEERPWACVSCDRTMRTRRRIVRPILLSAAALAASACGAGTPTPHARSGRAPDVVLITIDTLRADRLGCYGYTAARTPTLDGLAKRGARFEVAVAHAPLTAPSHASVLTGLTPLGPRCPRQRGLRAAAGRAYAGGGLP